MERTTSNNDDDNETITYYYRYWSLENNKYDLSFALEPTTFM
jgi:hypothetical protein